MSNATDELRALLDERGVEYRIDMDWSTEWESSTGDYSSGVDCGDGKLIFTGCLTPAQAIDATLGRGMCETYDVLRSIDQLRRDLAGYHGQLKAHNDLQRHCDNQRKRIGELEGILAKDKVKRGRLAKMRKLVAELYECSRRCGCDRCGFKDGCAIFDRMAQMGIEVDG